MTAARVAAALAMAACLSACPASDDGTALLRNETGPGATSSHAPAVREIS